MKHLAPLPKGCGNSQSRLLRWLALTLGAGLLMVGSAQTAQAKPALGKQWPNSKQMSFEAIDHTAWNTLLQKYVDDDGYVAYAKWQRNKSDHRALLNYLADLGRANPAMSSSPQARVAFWINAYNAVTIEGILQEYPTSSIRNHTARVFGYNIWQDLPLKVGNSEYSLEAIEHEKLRKLGEPRIHFAIVCASVGCPRLLNQAYTAAGLERQLSENTRDFFSRRQNFRVDAKRGRIDVSSILDWFGTDFGANQSEQFRYLKKFLPDSAQRLATNPRTTVGYLDYDWSLNDQSRKK